MLDATQTIDTLKLRFYNDWLYNAHIYDEGESGFHKEITTKMVAEYVDPLELPKDAEILDLGCGPGYFLDEMKTRGYTNLTGVTLSPGDIKLCESKGHKVAKYDLSFLPVQDGYIDESVDFIFLRHALEHSPYPIFSLVEYNRILKQGGKMYIELPQPDCDRRHEFNLNHYSILGASQWIALLQRTGFNLDKFNNFEFDLVVGEREVEETNEAGETVKVKKPVTAREKYYCIVVTKARPLDLK
jgi:SAM-dependent methyltransferase